MSEDKLSKREEKELKKMLKEHDKIQRDALVERINQKDQEKTKKAKGGENVVENTSNAISTEELYDLIPKLREISRQTYLTHREEQQLDLMKRRLE